MNSQATLAASVLLAAGTAFVVTWLVRPQSPTEDQNRSAVASTQRRLGEELDELRARVEALANAPRPESAAQPAVERTAAPAVSEAQIAAAVDAWMQRHGGAPAPAGAAGATTAAGFDLDADWPLLAKSYFDDPAGWKKAFAAGRMDDVIKKFEELAKAAPNDPKVQMELASAYLSYLQLDQSKWPLSLKADKVFDNVLALDDKHWEARFTKAMSYTFWPPVMGKQKEAITHFELLMQQQDAMPPESHQAETYLYLGNLYETRGDSAKAREIWRKGARRHPDNQELAKKAK
jgi:tetratricopeptide (TPR) repeat protein